MEFSTRRLVLNSIKQSFKYIGLKLCKLRHMKFVNGLMTLNEWLKIYKIGYCDLLDTGSSSNLNVPSEHFISRLASLQFNTGLMTFRLCGLVGNSSSFEFMVCFISNAKNLSRGNANKTGRVVKMLVQTVCLSRLTPNNLITFTQNAFTATVR